MSISSLLESPQPNYLNLSSYDLPSIQYHLCESVLNLFYQLLISILWSGLHALEQYSTVFYIHRVQKKSDIFVFYIYLSQCLDKFHETFKQWCKRQPVFLHEADTYYSTCF